MHAAALTLAAALFAHPTPVVGPPLVCFPWKIADAPSLPWGNGPFEMGDLEPAKLESATRQILLGTDDPFVHMETLRRAVVYAVKFDERSKSAKGGYADGLVAMVDDRAIEMLAAGKGEALAWLDVGYVREALAEMGRRENNAGLAYLEKAAALAPNEAGIRMAACGASLDRSSGAERARKHFDAALLAAKAGSLAHENVLAYGKHYLGHDPGSSKKASG